MTPQQKIFKHIQAEAKKLKAKNKSLKHTEAVKQAWDIYKKGSKNYIRVVSGIKLNYKRGKLGSLPVNFTGSVLGLKFRVYNQYNLDGSITCQIVEDRQGGELITNIEGRQGEADKAADKFFGRIEGEQKKGLSEKDTREVKARLKKFFLNLSQDVKKFNSGKDTRTRKNEKLVITKTKPKKEASLKDNIKDLLRGDKKRLKYGYTIIPGKVMAGFTTELSRQYQSWLNVYARLHADLLHAKTVKEKNIIRREIKTAKLMISQLKKKLSHFPYH